MSTLKGVVLVTILGVLFGLLFSLIVESFK